MVMVKKQGRIIARQKLQEMILVKCSLAKPHLVDLRCEATVSNTILESLIASLLNVI